MPLWVRSKDFATEQAESASILPNKEIHYKVRELHEEDGTWFFTKVTSEQQKAEDAASLIMGLGPSLLPRVARIIS